MKLIKLIILLFFTIDSCAMHRVEQITGQLNPLKILQKSRPATFLQKLADNKKLTPKEMVELFKADCLELQDENLAIKQHDRDKVLRVATYNIHFWHSPDKKFNFENIIKIIKDINADIIILQEVSIINREKIEQEFKKFGYEYQVFCEAMKLTYGPFGNMIVSKYKLEQQPVVKTFECDKQRFEKRNFINIKVNGISIYGTHLDVYDKTENRRYLEVAELIEFSKQDNYQNILIAGDFNAIRKSDYNYKVNNNFAWDLINQNYRKFFKTNTPTIALDLLAKANFKDCFNFCNINAPKFTVWSGTIVDYIFLNKNWNREIMGCYVLYNAESDHLPIIIDIAKSN